MKKEKKDKKKKSRTKTELMRVNGYLKEVTTFFDPEGKVVSSSLSPVMLELRWRDISQIFVGAFLIAAPLCFTEEVWNLSIQLNRNNVYGLGFVSILIATLYIYFNVYRNKLRGHVFEFIKKVIATYFITISSVILILFLIDKFPINETPYIALKRVILIGFPSIFGAIITDNLK